MWRIRWQLKEKNNFAELLFFYFYSFEFLRKLFFFFTRFQASDLRLIFDFVFWTKILILGCVSSTYFQAVIIKFTSSILFDNTFLINHQLQTLWKQLWALTMGLRQKGPPPRTESLTCSQVMFGNCCKFINYWHKLRVLVNI